MNPLNYSRMLDQPHTARLLLLLERLLNDEQSTLIEASLDSAVNFLLQVNSNGSILSSDRMTISSHIDARNNTRIKSVFLSDEDALERPMRSIMRCLSLPGLHKFDLLNSAISNVQNAQTIHAIIRSELNSQTSPAVSSLDIASLIVEMERHVIRHTNACTRHLDGELEEHDVERIELGIEADMLARCTALGISPFKLEFNRDPRGATVVLNHKGMSYMLPVNELRVHFEPAVMRPKDVVATPEHKRQTQVVDAASTPVINAVQIETDSIADPQKFVSAIDEDLLEILREGRWSQTNVFLLPEVQLERKLYQRVAEAITLANGKWNTSKQGFIFKDGSEKFSALLATGSTVDVKRFDFFATPATLAHEAVQNAHIEPGMLVLEPEAGEGAIADELATIVGKENVICYELLPEHAAKLRQKGYVVMNEDFLSVVPMPIYDRIVMNPPFGNQADMKHIEHASKFLKPDGELVAIMSPVFQTRQSHQSESFRALMSAAGEKIRDVDAGTFKESGTNVKTVMVRIDASRLPWNQTDQEIDRGRTEVCRG